MPDRQTPKTLTYDAAKQLARHDDVAIRRDLATRNDMEPEILYFLSGDAAPEVRRAVAENTSAPRHADVRLAEDADEGVRVGLAAKIGRLAPELSDDEKNRLHRMTHEALRTLVRDKATQVRRVLAEVLKDVANAPPDVIRRLARDVEIVVAGPVLEHSPVLTDEDILEIIASDPVVGTQAAISRRTNVSERISAALVDDGNTDVIASLLANPTAQIQEETLDRILDRAPTVKAWHEPLVRRPSLPAPAITRLVHFVADNLIGLLTQRDDLDVETLSEVRQVVRRRIDAGELDADQVDDAGDGDPRLERAIQLRDAGQLTDRTLAEAIGKGDLDLVFAGVSVLTHVPLAKVKRIISEPDALGIVCLTWAAGLPMAIASDLQTKVARVRPENLIVAGEDGEFSLSEAEMEWQLSLRV